MQCPRDVIVLEQVLVEGVNVDRCSVCGGTWLDHGELEAIEAHVAARPRTAPDDTVSRSYEMAAETSRPLLGCPRCGDEMERREYGLASQILVDSCVHGHGEWLDAGELEALERFYERERVEAKEGSGFIAWLRSL